MSAFDTGKKTIVPGEIPGQKDVGWLSYNGKPVWNNGAEFSAGAIFDSLADMPAGIVGPVWVNGNSVLIDTTNRYIDAKIASKLTDIEFPSPYEDPLGTSAMHPCVLIAPNGTAWNGYKYWASFTPYPSGNSDYENPCVVASNDLLTWAAPTTNPITAKPTVGFNSDPHLCFSADGKYLFLFYRVRASQSDLVCKYTTDGVYWSDEIVLLEGTAGVKDYASPSVFFDSLINAYRIIWHDIDDDANAWPIWSITVNTLLNVVDDSSKIAVAIQPEAGRRWWHSWFGQHNGMYVAALVDNNGVGGAAGNIYLAQSYDFVTWSKALLINGGGLYRPALIPDLNKILISQSTSPTYQADLAFNKAASAQAKASYLANVLAQDLPALVVDSYDRADSDISVGQTDNGLSYAISGGGIAGISANRLYNVNATNTRALLTIDKADYHIYGKLQNTGGQSWLWFRTVDVNNFIRVGTTNGVSLSLHVYVASELTVDLQSVIKSYEGDIEIEVICIGQRVKVIVNDNVVFDELLDYHLAATKVGWQFTGDTTYADYLVVV